MTIEQVRRVQESFQKVLATKESSAQIFYDRLFELDPNLRSLFKGSMKEQGEKFMSMLDMAVGGLRRFDDVVSAVRALGERHIGYGVLPPHYGTFRTALLWMLEEVLAEDFTDETRAAWVEMYDLLSRAMTELPPGASES